MQKIAARFSPLIASPPVFATDSLADAPHSTNRSPTAVDSYRRKIRETFAKFKGIHCFDELATCCLPLTNGQGRLIPVTELHADDPVFIRLLTDFRAPVTTFPAIFEVTVERTGRWLRTLLLDVPDRILFLVQNAAGQVVGHLGFARSDNAKQRMELDNVIRGRTDVAPGLMSQSVERLCQWATTEFAPREIYLRVMEYNAHGIRFYERLGFVATHRQPLRKVQRDGEIHFLPRELDDTAPADAHFLFMNRFLNI